ncbi:Signal recognition particle core component, variant 2 [Trebouxia sp. C0009 RCD-2024]
MASPKASKEDQVQTLFTKLAPLIKGQQHKKAIKTLDSILKLQPADEDAIKCKVAVLLEGSLFQEALDYISSTKNNSFQFEQAYAMYRLNKLQDALDILAGNLPDTPGKALLEAQLHHRQGNYSAAIATYNKLVQQYKVKTAEVGTNIVAAYVSGGRAHEVLPVMDALALSASDGFEIAFNQACADVAVGKLEAAEQQLLLAQRLGRETLYEDDLPEEEVEAELAPVTSQLAHVASMLGRSDEATASYQDLLTKHQAEENVLAVVQNNVLAIQSSTQSHQKRFAAEALKKFESLMDHEAAGQLSPGVESRLSSQQKQALHLNHALLLLLSGKAEACQEKLTQLKRRSGS